MPSHSTVAPRRVPRQVRGQQRVFTLLNAASEVLAEKGFEAATMSEVAERAQTAIGSLYQFFPNKESIACALNTRCCEDIEKLWLPLFSESRHLDLDEGLARLIDTTVRYISTHPVVVALFQTPKCTWNKGIRERLEQQVATFLMARNPRLKPKDADLHASICLRLVRSCCEHFLDSDKAKRRRIVSEYKALVSCYAQSRLEPN